MRREIQCSTSRRLPVWKSRALVLKLWKWPWIVSYWRSWHRRGNKGHGYCITKKPLCIFWKQYISFVKQHFSFFVDLVENLIKISRLAFATFQFKSFSFYIFALHRLGVFFYIFYINLDWPFAKTLNHILLEYLLGYLSYIQLQSLRESKKFLRIKRKTFSGQKLKISISLYFW